LIENYSAWADLGLAKFRVSFASCSTWSWISIFYLRSSSSYVLGRMIKSVAPNLKWCQIFNSTLAANRPHRIPNPVPCRTDEVIELPQLLQSARRQCTAPQTRARPYTFAISSTNDEHVRCLRFPPLRLIQTLYTPTLEPHRIVVRLRRSCTFRALTHDHLQYNWKAPTASCYF